MPTRAGSLIDSFRVAMKDWYGVDTSKLILLDGSKEKWQRQWQSATTEPDKGEGATGSFENAGEECAAEVNCHSF